MSRVKGEILQVVTDDDRRGAQTFALDLHRGLDALGCSVRTVALAPGDVGGLAVEVLGPRRRAVTTLGTLRRAMRNADVVVAHGSTTLPACAIAGTGTGVPFVYRQISQSRFWAASATRRIRVRLLLSRAARVVALWRGAADDLSGWLGVPADHIRVIPNAVPLERVAPATDPGHARAHLGLDPDRPVVLYVGALAIEKGVDVAIDAVGGLPGTQLLVVGDGPERGALGAARSERVGRCPVHRVAR